MPFWNHCYMLLFLPTLISQHILRQNTCYWYWTCSHIVIASAPPSIWLGGPYGYEEWPCITQPQMLLWLKTLRPVVPFTEICYALKCLKSTCKERCWRMSQKSQIQVKILLLSIQQFWAEIWCCLQTCSCEWRCARLEPFRQRDWPYLSFTDNHLHADKIQTWWCCIGDNSCA